MSDAVSFPLLNPDLNQILLVIGRKGSGKSVFAREVFISWPYIDKFVIDPTGDADPGPGATTIRTLPAQLPEGIRKGDFKTTRWIADPSSKTYREDLDRAVGLALYPKHRRVLLWVDEAGEVFPAGRTGPSARTLLQQSRHWYASLIACTPRPVTIDPLLLSQADRVVIYDLPHPRDRERVAAGIGVPPGDLNRALDETRARGPHWYLLYDARAHELYRCPPLPISAGYKHAEQ
ncbi:MAG: hypothetical protein QM714_00005 [Nocardioides sp.]|uniref:hypothetical protein n=1 Tax=Nocardioides sp. TaxID=35761 RepID=UPI0039E29236